MSQELLVPLAQIIKRHTYKENKWKCVALSGFASPWIQNLSTGYLLPDLMSRVRSDFKALVQTPIHVEAGGKDAFFLTRFEDSLDDLEGFYVYIERSRFPQVKNTEIYLCDLFGVDVQSVRGSLKVIRFFENFVGALEHEVSSVTLLLENSDRSISVEVPLAVLRQHENKWHLDDLEVWIEVLNSQSRPDDPDE